MTKSFGLENQVNFNQRDGPLAELKNVTDEFSLEPGYICEVSQHQPQWLN